MNILERVKNNVEYAYYRRIRSKSLRMMEKYEDDIEQWNYWAERGTEALKKCAEIPLH